MTKSDNPPRGGGFYAPPQQAQTPGQQPLPVPTDPGSYHPGVQQMAAPHPGVANQPHQGTMGQVPPQAAQPLAPMQPQVAGQLPPPMMPNQETMAPNQEAYGEYAAPQGAQVEQVEQVVQPPMAPQYAAPGDDYQYPQGQSGLPEVPAVAVPPAMRAPLEQAMVPAPQVPGVPQLGVESAYVDPAASTGEQISQRLAQLQNQYDEEVSAENWEEPHNANSPSHQPADPYGVAPSANEENLGYAPQPHAQGEQYGQSEEVAPQNYQEQPPQAFQQAPQGYQQPPQAQLAPPPLMPAQQGSYEYSGPTPDTAQHQFAQGENAYPGGSSIQQEQTGGGMKKFMFTGAFVAALAVGGGAAYTYQYTDLFGARSASGPAPTIRAASSPVKVLKQKMAGAGDSINKAMHNRLSGSDLGLNAGAGGDSIEKVVDLAIAGTSGTANNVTAASKGLMADAAVKRPGASIGINTPRRVKTLIVRPDGTILRPAGNDLAKAKAKEGAANLAALESGGGMPSALKPGAFNVSGNNKIRRMKTIGEASSARILGGNSVTPLNKPPAPIAKTRIVKKTIVNVKKPIIVARAAPVQNIGAVGTPFVVQVTSRSTRISALAAFADMREKYPNLIGTFKPDIQRANLGSKGVWYRLRVGPVGSKVAASDLCSSLKQAGHPGCFVRRK